MTTETTGDAWCPIYVQPPCKPELREYRGDASVNASRDRLAELIGVPHTRIVAAKLAKWKDELAWFVVVE